MRTVSICSAIIVAVSIVLSACNSKADAALGSFDTANAAWAECRAKVALAGIKTSMTADELVDKAFKDCAIRENEFYAAGVAEFGPEWRKSGGDIQRDMFRQAMLVRVKEIRAGKPPSNPFIAWGRCTGAKAQIEISSLDAVEVSADRIMKACKNYQDAVEADARSKFGEAGARGIMADVLPKVRAHNAEVLVRLRTSRNATNGQQH